MQSRSEIVSEDSIPLLSIGLKTDPPKKGTGFFWEVFFAANGAAAEAEGAEPKAPNRDEEVQYWGDGPN